MPAPAISNGPGSSLHVVSCDWRWRRHRKLQGECLRRQLLSNAVRVGDGSVHLRVSDGSGPVRVEVTDASQTAPELRHRGPDATRGRGLVLVEALASAWGHDLTPEGKTVWFVVS